MTRRQGDASTPRIGLVGAGRMGCALLKGWLGRGIPGSSIQIIEPNPSSELSRLVIDAGSTIVSILDAAAVEVLVLAVKPQSSESVAQYGQALLGQHGFVLSIMAGTTIAELRKSYPSAASIIRAMPNLATAVGQGMTAVVAEPTTGISYLTIAEQLLADVGSVEWLHDERLMDAVTALSGSGPAYIFYMTECLARAGLSLGLPAETSMRLARAAVQGTGAILATMPEGPEHLRRQVTSPGGTTEAGLEILMADERLQEILDQTLMAAARRSKELGLPLRSVAPHDHEPKIF